MEKRGQVTVFVVLGILILLIVGSFFVIRTFLVEKKAEIEEAKVREAGLLGASVTNYVESCLKDTGEEALVFIGKHGGYYELPLIFDAELLLPFYFYENKSRFVSEEGLERELGKYVDGELFFCLKDFTYFKEKGYRIEQGKTETKVRLGKGKVLFEVNFPVYLMKGGVGKELLSFEANIPSRLKTIHGVIGRFMLGQEEEPGSICVSCLLELVMENDLRVEMGPIGEQVVFTIIDEKVKVKNEDYRFEFVNQYSRGEYEI